ncbi:pyridoxamine 5'-phosphate oxidase family protein [Fulvivirga sp. RKSG066]|uniref:pyridoxamine 5'-phosphate oxidase family protein n=1 Tax=Fulvivirga aurantia TaxID=2529383 RepID=UPI0012BB654B|nr:pyridoxamine 5'-phosphate oxidase family protein [Fulvivirga aurantia]MTI22205.1 pyridoxamine 5'-phosphate oxidase family protein [Fulvivirga aurantia]
MLGTLNRPQIDNLLYSQIHGRLGCTADGKVYIVPLTYAYDGDYIYVHTIEGLKIKMMRKNPQVCFEVERIDDMAHWQSACLWGSYEELEGQQAEDGLQLIINRTHPFMTSDTSRPKHGLDRPGQPRPRKASVIFRIKVNEATGRFEKRNHM